MALRNEGYWDEHYELELNNYQEDGDEGEVWFGKNLNKRIVDWILERLGEIFDERNESAIVDVGCGNAYTVCTLLSRWLKLDIKQDKHQLKILGIDYSANSIELAKRITSDRGFSNSISLKQCDFLDKDQLNSLCGEDKFDFVVDKGTFDAICLLASNSTNDLENAKLKYKNSLRSIVREGTSFILASCNHTEEELLQVFDTRSGDEFVYKLIGRIDTPTLKFGGKQGSQVTCLIFKFISNLER